MKVIAVLLTLTLLFGRGCIVVYDPDTKRHVCATSWMHTR